MAEKDYQTIYRPYGSSLQRGEVSNTSEYNSNKINVSGSTNASVSVNDTAIEAKGNVSGNAPGDVGENGNVETQPVNNQGAIGDVWINNFIRSQNWSPKKTGFNIDGQTGHAEFTDVYVSGDIEALTGNIGGFVIGADYIIDEGNSFGLASTVTGGDDVRFWAGDTFVNRSSAPFVILESGKVIATSGTIGGWDMTSSLLRSEISGDRIELDKGDNRISIFDSTNEKVVMGYLDGLPKNDGTGNWGSGDYGFWARSGDKLSIDGDGEYVSGDWVIKDDADFLVQNSVNDTIIRLGTDDEQKGLFIYNTNGDNIAKYTSEEILVGSD
ncbi:MAG: hypothetical protein U9O94_10025, partial [Nanoarchaeota archaeon]|nr:hypothetical protein [Nanoarchaeota archaeon]